MNSYSDGIRRWRKALRRRWKHQPGWWPWLLSLPPRGVLCVLRSMPPETAVRLAEALGRQMWRIPRRRRVGEAHLAQAFPEWTARERSRIGRISCGQMTRGIAELIVYEPRWKPEKYESATCYEEGTRELLRGRVGKGTVFVHGHFGSMEALAGLLGVLGLRPLTVGRMPINYYLGRMLAEVRSGWGVDVVERRGALRKMLTRIRDGGSALVPMDINARQAPIFVPWFGRLAATEPSAAWLALQTGKPLIVCWGVRLDDPQKGGVGATLVRPEQEPVTPDDASLVDVTASIHRALEAAIRRFPEQYFWIHDRYRTRPPSMQTARFPGWQGPVRP